jgi:D-apionolactonase
VGEKVTSDPFLAEVRERLASFGVGIPFAAGTDAYFAEINRAGFSSRPGALPCYSMNPQVHASDDVTLMENLVAQADTVEAAWRLSSRPVVVSPITLRPRFNPNATSAFSPAAEGELPPEVDVRQLSPFCAAWTLGSIAALSATGHVHSLTYYETTGWRGVMETERGSLLPERFPSRAGVAFPVFEVLAALSSATRLCRVHSSDPLSVVGLGVLDDQNQTALLVANLRPQTQTIRLNASARHAQADWISGGGGTPLLRETASNTFELQLPAYACVRVQQTSFRAIAL